MKSIWGTAYLWLYIGLSILLFAMLYPLAIRAVQKIQFWQAFLVGAFGLLVYQSLQLVWNR